MTLQELSYLSSAVSASCFLVSLIVAIYSVNRARRTQRYSTASQLWDAYMGRAIQYPKFAYPPSFDALYDFENRTFDKTREEFERYEWFLSSFLRTAEEILSEFDPTDHRSRLVLRNIRCHRKYLAWRRAQKIENDFIDALSQEVRRLIDLVIEEHV